MRIPFTKPTTVAGVLAGIYDAIDRLDALATTLDDRREKRAIDIAQLREAQLADGAEINRAVKAAAKLRELVA